MDFCACTLVALCVFSAVPDAGPGYRVQVLGLTCLGLRVWGAYVSLRYFKVVVVTGKNSSSQGLNFLPETLSCHFCDFREVGLKGTGGLIDEVVQILVGLWFRVF